LVAYNNLFPQDYGDGILDLLIWEINQIKENNMQVQTRKHIYTPEEYLELEEKALYKSEYRNGEIIPMTGGTTNHNQIALNFASSLLYVIRGKKYRVFIGDVRLWIPEYREYTYPDVIVTDGKPIYAGKNNTTVTNPLLIVEVLSKSTKNYDQGDKFTFYRSIPQFKEYVLVEQNQYQVMHYSKTNEGEWIFREYKSEDDIVKLQHLDFELSLVDIYQDVNFEDRE
jgi:Uma2 family endonuclease